MEFELNKFTNKIFEYKNTLFDSKKYCLVFLILTLVSFLSIINIEPINHTKFFIILFSIIFILGIFCILYAMRHLSDDELYKTAFVVIICFGLISSLLLPICSVSDEKEHLVRAEITSQGVIFPHWNGADKGLTRLYNLTDGDVNASYNEGVGYNTIQAMRDISKDRNLNFFDSSHDTDKINYTSIIYDSAFEQNPFYGYLPQAIGILLAKLLDLNLIWLLWLPRIANLLSYAALVSLAIKKTPYLKIPILAIACLPIAVYQASSLSIDSMIFGLGLLAIAYFIYMYKSEEKTLENKEIVIFAIICLLLALCKLTYLAFIFSLFFVPRKNFKDKKNIRLILLVFGVVLAICLVWSRYASPALLHSWRSHWQPVNSSMQINYILNHHEYALKLLNKFTNEMLYNFHNQFLNFFDNTVSPHFNDKFYLINLLINAFLAIVLIAYPNNTKFDLKTRLGAAGIIILIYFGTCIVQLMSYTVVGGFNLGLNFRYFVPLLALIPVVFQINYGDFVNKEFDKYALVMSIGFLSVYILALVCKYY